MGKRAPKSYSEYKADPTVKTPALAWLLDRKALYVSVAVVGALGCGMLGWQGYQSLERITAEPVEDSPYADVKPVASPGLTWGADFVKDAPAGVKKWTVVEATTPSHGLLNDQCSTLDTPNVAMLASYSASGSGVKLLAQVYGAGQARKSFEQYATEFASCAGFERGAVGDSGIEQFTFGDVVVYTAGDALVAVEASDASQLKKLKDFYATKMKTSLEDSKCLSLESSEDDALRSFYVDKDAYKGYYNSEQLKTRVDVGDLPTVTGLELSDVKDVYATEPEAPLPDDMPELPKEVTRPAVAEQIPEQTDFSKTVSFLVRDDDGPACGWAWSGVTAPEYDDEELKAGEKNALRDGQNTVDTDALNYVEDNVHWAIGTAQTAASIDDYNIYVKKLNEVHSRWNWLEGEREKLKTPWYNYVEAHDNWSTFDARKKSATEDYNEAVEECKAANDAVEKWEDKWRDKYEEQKEAREKEEAKPSPAPTPSPSPSDGGGEEQPSPEPTETRDPILDVDIPDRPEPCESEPVPEPIVNQNKPDEPEAPAIPKGVTIPNSWPEPQ